jgi:hypothetical protein
MSEPVSVTVNARSVTFEPCCVTVDSGSVRVDVAIEKSLLEQVLFGAAVDDGIELLGGIEARLGASEAIVVVVGGSA